MGSVKNARNNSKGSGSGSGSGNRSGNCLPGEAKKILKSLASRWGDTIMDEDDGGDALQVIPLKGAMTNEVYQIKWPTQQEYCSRKVIVRIYGEGVEVFFDRDDEIRTFEFMSKQGQGPLLLGRFPNGRVEEFIHARTLSASDLHDSDISALIAAKMKEFHDLDMPGPKKVLLNWLKAAKSMSPPEEAEAFRLDAMDEEISILEKTLSHNNQLIGFCHNDLQYGNIMIDETAKSITIIDYEYASYNHVAYDIANHFCEMAANYHTETPHILDYSKYPGNQPSDTEIRQLIEDVEKYTLASHLHWGLWGIISVLYASSFSLHFWNFFDYGTSLSILVYLNLRNPSLVKDGGDEMTISKERNEKLEEGDGVDLAAVVDGEQGIKGCGDVV
ncbi:hypothetical protein TEA_015942 [Camellia sinensis var. sinensis]|uniref:Choline kinase N-terminal domain-containing protein n=1 Tax=Camellia sinensis var. sinensis TaxID=542762 RepID=A0A4S4F341_CAMSN|nr:hypothetical protein TEA_015942 [Camellia sinensis var. sinensis]